MGASKLSMSKLPEIPKIEYDENGIPFASDFGDSYFSKSGGIEECREVFLKGCGLPENWRGKDHFTIAETGFGTGLNFLTTWKLWDEDCRKTERAKILHFISFELYPLSKAQAQTALKFWPELVPYSTTLIENWPKRVFGVQRIWLGDNVVLTMVIGDIEETMPKLGFKADAWFLDGFAPNRNGRMWGDLVFEQIVRLSKPNVRIATFSVSNLVRSGLEKAGFKYQKQKGFASKRERLEAWCEISPNIKQKARTNLKVMIIGGGISGHSAANALEKRGFKTIIIDNDKSGAIKASNNPAGLIMPRLDKVESIDARFYRCAFLYAAQFYASLNDGFSKVPIIEFPKNARDLAKFAALEKAPPLDSDLLEFKDGHLNHLSGGIIQPKAILEALLGKSETIYAEVESLKHDTSGKWRAYDIDNSEIASADICIVANGAGINRLCRFSPNDVYGGMGTICHYENLEMSGFGNFGGKSYCLNIDNSAVFGASFKRCNIDETPIATQKEIFDNIENLRELAPKIAEQIGFDKVQARASMRVITRDLMPIIGPLEHEGAELYVIGALGSRGFSLAPIAGEIIACQINDEPMPIEEELLKPIHPKRLFAASAAF